MVCFNRVRSCLNNNNENKKKKTIKIKYVIIITITPKIIFHLFILFIIYTDTHIVIVM